MRIRLDLAYDGGNFAGWARQPELRTVEGVLSDALERILRRPVRLTVAGRTDAGVHAAAQVVSLDLDEVPSLRQVNAVLPEDLVVSAIAEVPEAFDARFAALGRGYRYRITDGPPDPLRRHDTLAYPRPLDAEAMRAAAAELVGEHDFAAYCRRREGATTVRNLRSLDIAREGAVITATLSADAFCHSMVRALVGALIGVGEGRLEVTVPGDVLRAGVRDGRIRVAPAHGLTLIGVEYPEGAVALELRQQASRRMRVPTRPAELADVPAILAMIDEAVVWLAEIGREGQWGSVPLSGDAHFVAMIEEAVVAGRMRVAIDRGAVVGALEVGGRREYVPAVAEPESYVRLLVTSRSRAPRMLGRELLVRVAEEAGAAGIGLVRVDCYRSQDRALIRVFERAGFVPTEEVDVNGWPGQILQRRV